MAGLSRRLVLGQARPTRWPEAAMATVGRLANVAAAIKGSAVAGRSLFGGSCSEARLFD